MQKKYRLTDETIRFNGVKLYRIEALKHFGYVNKGDKGGFVQSEENLSQFGNCWIYQDAKVFNNGYLCRDAVCMDNSMIYEDAMVIGDPVISGTSIVRGNAVVYGKAFIKDALIERDSDYITFKNWWSSMRYFTWTRSNNMWSVGCFYGTGEELIEKAYKDSELSGREYKRVVEYVESILRDEKLKKN